MNILICSVGRRVQLIEYFKKEFNKIEGKVIAVDCDPTAPALYHADYFEIVPRIDHPEYISVLKSICLKYEINGVLSLIDPELTLLASIKEEFEKDNIRIIISDKEVIDLCYDKYKTSKYLQKNNLPFVPSYRDFELVKQDLNNGVLTFPLIIKPRKGSGSKGVFIVENLHDLQLFWSEDNDLIIQPFIEGDEYCVECYIDLLTNDTVNLFSKRKINMRAGETDKSIAIKDPVLNDLTYRLIYTLKPSGPIDIDYFKTVDGKYIISEINPRFGGGYPYAYAMGENFIKSIISNLKGISNLPYESYLGEYVEGKTMVRYDHFIVL
ncbi:ATP-grasp domain-containing protein [Lederbergia wuyishanensis]|uniref:Carbamoyl-phosphate synthase large subunit n=1 Tax=Lederbergia wuyishanensis TaxID=1347903 RepID=A0ABU0D7W4_9BACI|nr:ATP-grasp domain-containing protein [Lederbergia wuyishanensis]MCJ8009132.1 ATP-grasp domain-containing protein [Lederbergia wuyishanensis]MDQ0344472.1 carbamoyl-phosphate synthase large subunit [Lederbergia wuyishanensis]